MESGSRSLYEQLGGFDAILALTRRWHERCLLDPEAAHPFEHELHPHHDVRLAAYLAEAFGGPKLYSAGYGDESSMQRIHAGNGVHTELDDACIEQFGRAMEDVGISGAAAEGACEYFRRATEGQRTWSAKDAEVPDALPFNFA